MTATPCWSVERADSSSPARPASWGSTCQPAYMPLGIWSGWAPVNIGVKVVRSPETVNWAVIWWPVSIQAQLGSSGVPKTET